MAATLCGAAGAVATFWAATAAPDATTEGDIRAPGAPSAAEPEDCTDVVADASFAGNALGVVRDATSAVSPARFAATVWGGRVATARAAVVERGALLLAASCVRRAASAGRSGDVRAAAAVGGGPDGTLATRAEGDNGLAR